MIKTKLPIIFCCIHCGNKISEPTARYGKGSCNKCWKQGENHPRFGVKLSKVTKDKISNSLKGLLKGSKSYLYIDGRSSMTYFCECGRQISYKAIINGTGKCGSCSKLGRLNGNWQNGIGRLPYHFTFNRLLKFTIRERDNFICLGCDKTEQQELKDFNRVLSIHHINYDKENCNENNLITVCQSCNSIANFNRDYWFAYYTYIIQN